MKMVILADNNPHPEIDLLTEHGISIYFEAGGFKWLYDTGASDKFLINAGKLGVDIEDVDFLVLSHGHADHTGGLEAFTGVNKKAQIIVSANVKGKKFFSRRGSGKREIGLNLPLLERNSGRITFVSGNMRVIRDIALICEFPKLYDAPRANIHLTTEDSFGERPDGFTHEMALVIERNEGVAVLSGCSHNGVLNILDACCAYLGTTAVKSFIGGIHLPDSRDKAKYESEFEISGLGRSVAGRFPGLHLFAGHCTGSRAIKRLSAAMGDKFTPLHCGSVINV